MQLWIRVDANVARDPAVAAFAEALGISTPTALGHLVMVWGVMAEHTPDGSLEAVGVKPLEEWANWRGKRGAFHAAFVQHFVKADQVNGWAERQGKLIERAAKDRARKHRGNSAEVPPPPRGNSAVTERNGTEQKEKPLPRPRRTGPSRPPSPPAPASHPAARYDHLQAAWKAVGSLPIALFRKGIKPLLDDGHRTGAIARGIAHYAKRPGEKRLEWFVQQAAQHIAAGSAHHVAALCAAGADPGTWALDAQGVRDLAAQHADNLARDDAALEHRLATEAAA